MSAWKGILDKLSSSAAVALDLRLLTKGYTGPLIRVRRSTDNAEQDFYPTAKPSHSYSGVADKVNRWVDTAAILAFCGAGSGYVAKIYDQKGTNHATQTVAANQPRIVNTGVLEAKNGRPTLRNYASTCFMNVPRFANPSANWAHLVLGAVDSLAINANDILGGDGYYNAAGYYVQVLGGSASATFGKTGASYAAAVTGTTVAGAIQCVTITHSASNVATTRLNGAAGTPTSVAGWTSGAANYAAGKYLDPTVTTTLSLLGNLATDVVFQAMPSTADIQLLERNAGAAYGITVA
jgi:hypothetical protein